MKLKIILFVLLLGGCCYSQKNPKPKMKEPVQNTIHEILIFKWCRDGNTNIKRYIKIDSLGNVIIKGQNFLEKVNMRPFTKSIHKFIASEKPEKIPGYNEAPQIAEVPEIDKQSIYISIILTEDYIKEKKLTNKTHYSWHKSGLEKTQNDYPLFQYLDPKDVKMLQRFLE